MYGLTTLYTTEMHIFVARSDSCRRTQKGTEYNGTISQTYTGKTCQAWTAQFPHPHTNNHAFMFPDDTMADAQNYCRNPGAVKDHPWCFTTDPAVQWEFCDVHWCDSGEICFLYYKTISCII